MRSRGGGTQTQRRPGSVEGQEESLGGKRPVAHPEKASLCGPAGSAASTGRRRGVCVSQMREGVPSRGWAQVLERPMAGDLTARSAPRVPSSFPIVLFLTHSVSLKFQHLCFYL